jgi:pimeloyl-ACP methyl ester carboxylesterase
MRIRLENGLGLYYVPAGQGDATLVFLHPVGITGGVWAAAATELSEQFRCIVPDLPGHGESELPARPLAMPDMVAAVRGLVDAVGGGRVVLVGCSMGSAVAAATVAANADGIAGLVLSSASYARAPDRHASLTRRAAEARRGMPGILESTLSRWFTGEFAAASPDVVATVRDWLLAGDPVVHAWCWEILRDFEYVPVAPLIAVPTLVIAGGLDQSAKPPAVKALADAIAGAEYAEISGAGHLSPLEQPQVFAGLVADFLGRRLASP